jgi:hypothetical protein
VLLQEFPCCWAGLLVLAAVSRPRACRLSAAPEQLRVEQYRHSPSGMSGAAVAAFDVEAPMPDAPTSSGSSRSRLGSASGSHVTAQRRVRGHSRSPRGGSSAVASSSSPTAANSPPAAPQTAAMAASGSTTSSNRAQKPLPRYSRTQLCLEVLDIISFFTMLAATACGAAFCILVFDTGEGPWGEVRSLLP